QLRLGRFGFFLGHFFLDRLRRVVHQVLRFLQAEARQLADDLDDVDLRSARIGQDDVEFRLLLRFGGAAGSSAGHDGHRSGGGDAEFFFDRLDKLVQFQNGHAFDGFQDLFLGHGDTSVSFECCRNSDFESAQPACAPSFCSATALTACAKLRISACSTLSSMYSSPSRRGRSASALIWSKPTTLPSTMPAFTFRFSFVLANSMITLAGATASSLLKAMAVGPVRCSSSSVSSAMAVARRIRVFFTTRNSMPASRSFLRNSLTSATVRPR